MYAPRTRIWKRVRADTDRTKRPVRVCHSYAGCVYTIKVELVPRATELVLYERGYSDQCKPALKIRRRHV